MGSLGGKGLKIDQKSLGSWSDSRGRFCCCCGFVCGGVCWDK